MPDTRQCKYAQGLDAQGLEPGDLPSRAEAERAGCGATSVLEHRRGTCACANADTGLTSGGGDIPKIHTDPPAPRDHLDLGPDGGNLTYHTTDPEPIRDWTDVLRHLGADPDVWAVAGETVRVSRWQQSARAKDGDRDVVWLSAYRAEIHPKRDAVDLPALYAEAARTTPVEPVHRTMERTVVVAWGDVQTGKVDNLGGTRELLKRLNEKRVALDQYLTGNPCSRVVVADVGDIVEGIENTASQLATNDLSLMDQVDVAATELWRTIRLCAGYAPVDVLAIPSNHAQHRRGKGLIGKPTDDWGLHINKRLEHLAEEVGLDATFHRPVDDWSETLVHDVHGTRLGLAHGHQAGSPDKVTTWWGRMSHAGVMDADVCLTGHFHHLRIQPSGRSPRTGRSRWHIQCPTLDNGSAWVDNTLGGDGDPGLLVFTITTDGLDMSTLTIL